MSIPITRDIKILLLNALKRGYFNDVEAVKLNASICYDNSLMSLRRIVEVADECSKMNEQIRQGDEACSVTHL